MGEIGQTKGFMVADACGRSVGEVECPMYGASEHEPDALAVRSGLLRRRHFVVPATAIDAIDKKSQSIGLRIERGELRRFL